MDIFLLVVILVLLHQLLHYRKLANLDFLSGLYNKRQFDADMNPKNFRRSTDPSFLVLLDIDKFKIINDTLGHKEGDRILTEFSILLNSLRTDDRVYRIGGDEFAILTSNLIVISKIKEKTDISISFGYANVKTSENAFEEADKMLYENKVSKCANIGYN